VSEQTDHERDMERFAAQITRLNAWDAALAQSDPRNGQDRQQDGQR